MQAIQNAAINKELPKILYAQCAYFKNINDAIQNAERVKPFVDICLIITDIDPLPTVDGIIFKQHPWVDDFPTYHNHIIEEAKILKADYVLHSDVDEHFNDMFLSHLKMIVFSNPQFNGFNVYSHLFITDHVKLDDGTLDREAPGGLGVDSNFWKLMLWRIEPTTKYEKTGDSEKCVHHTIVGDWNVIKLPKQYYYTHDKTAEDIWSSSVRNIFICGGGDNLGKKNPYHVELRSICNTLEIFTWRDFVKYCEKGNIESALKNLILEHRNDSDKYYSSEIRDVFHWYFDYLHPEENKGYTSLFVKSQTVEALTEALVQRKYFEVLGRHTDASGKEAYVNGILTGKINPDELTSMLKHSDEYVRNHINMYSVQMLSRGATEVEQKIWGDLIKADIIKNYDQVVTEIKKFTDVTLAYCQMTYKGDLEDTITNVKLAKAYVDTCIVVYDDSLNADDIHRLNEAGARSRYHKWKDNFPMQRNNYLQEARAYGATWVMVSDPDEHFDEHLFQAAKAIAKQGETIGISLFLVNAHDIFTDDEKGQHVDNPAEHVPDYYKNLFYKLLPDVMYIGVGETQNLHENLVGSLRGYNLPKEYFYRHIKSHVDIWEHSARNIYVGGGGMNMGLQIPAYKEFCDIVKDDLGFKTWYQFRDYLKAGNISPKLKEFIIKNRNNYGHDYDSEYRELFKWYFNILHPEENFDSLTTDVDDHGPKLQQLDDEIESFVNQKYKEILRRDADQPGLKYYTKEIKESRIKKEELIGILTASEEYRAIVGSQALMNIRVG